MHIENLAIKNFKSIQHLELSNFKRINLFIGRPNVGKSNIIEALSLFSIPYLKFFHEIGHQIRFEHHSELFFEGDFEKESFVKVNNNIKYGIQYNHKDGLSFDANGKIIQDQRAGSSGAPSQIRMEKYTTGIKRYIFDEKRMRKPNNFPFLQPPFGNNLLATIENLPQLKREVVDLFAQYQLRLVFDKASNSLKIMKERGGDIFLLPYTSVADTLQRVIFFKTAVASNTDSCLLFEEPEAHAFPPYIAHITQEIIQSESNQFFITTHSPIVLQNFLENARTDLAIFMVDYKKQATTVKALTEQQIFEVYKYGIDLFFNQEAYL